MLEIDSDQHDIGSEFSDYDCEEEVIEESAHDSDFKQKLSLFDKKNSEKLFSIQSLF